MGIFLKAQAHVCYFCVKIELAVYVSVTPKTCFVVALESILFSVGYPSTRVFQSKITSWMANVEVYTATTIIVDSFRKKCMGTALRPKHVLI